MFGSSLYNAGWISALRHKVGLIDFIFIFFRESLIELSTGLTNHIIGAFIIFSYFILEHLKLEVSVLTTLVGTLDVQIPTLQRADAVRIVSTVHIRI